MDKYCIGTHLNFSVLRQTRLFFNNCTLVFFRFAIKLEENNGATTRDKKAIGTRAQQEEKLGESINTDVHTLAFIA